MKRKNLILLFILVLEIFFPVISSAASLRGDIDGNGIVNTSDVAFVLGWINSKRSSDPALIKTKALLLYPVTTSVVNIPSVANADLNNDGVVNTSDVAYVLGWINAKRIFDAQMISSKAVMLYPVTGSLETYPGIEIGVSAVNITIDNITAGSIKTQQ